MTRKKGQPKTSLLVSGSPFLIVIVGAANAATTKNPEDSELALLIA